MRAAPTGTPAFSVPWTDEAIAAAWPDIVETARRQGPFLGQALEQAHPGTHGAGVLMLRFGADQAVAREGVERQLERVTTIISARLGTATTVEFESESSTAAAGGQPSEPAAHGRGHPPRSAGRSPAPGSGARCRCGRVRFGAGGRRLNAVQARTPSKVDALADWQNKAPQHGQQADRLPGEQEEQRLAARTIEVQAGAGAVTVRVDGRGRLRGLTLEPAAFERRDAELLADLVLGAIAEAQRRAAEPTEPGALPEAR